MIRPKQCSHSKPTASLCKILKSTNGISLSRTAAARVAILVAERATLDASQSCNILVHKVKAFSSLQVATNWIHRF